MRFRWWVLIGVMASAAAFGPSVGFAQQGGFGGGGGGGGGGALSQNQSMLNQLNQSINGLPSILGRQAQGVFGTRTLGSATRLRYRMLMGRSQAGGGVGSQYGSSGAFSQTRRGTLPGSGMMTVSGLTGSNTANANQQRNGAQQQNPNQQANRPRNGAGLGGRRLTVRVGFEPGEVSPQELTAGLRQHYSRVPGLRSASATLVGRTVVLRGSAATDHARDLAEQLARLEPGIDVVRNELTTSQALPVPRQAPPPSRQNQSLPSPRSPNSGPSLDRPSLTPSAS